MPKYYDGYQVMGIVREDCVSLKDDEMWSKYHLVLDQGQARKSLHADDVKSKWTFFVSGSYDGDQNEGHLLLWLRTCNASAASSPGYGCSFQEDFYEPGRSAINLTSCPTKSLGCRGHKHIANEAGTSSWEID